MRGVAVLSKHIKEINMREKEEIFKVTKKAGTGTTKQTANKDRFADTMN